jgi:ribonuclease J
MREHEILSYADLRPVSVGERVAVGSFAIEPVRVTHSIPDATALAITTDAGVVVHSGDFKIDPDQPDGVKFDDARLGALGDAGVALLLSDSTNVDSEGTSGSESGVGEALRAVVEEAPSAVVVGLFASNVHRLRMLGEIARRTRRRIVILGRSVETHARVAHATGHLDWPSDVLFPPERIRELPRSSILGVATGTQGEARAALSRMAFGEHPHFTIAAGDTVVLSSRIIPGNEPDVFDIISALLRRGAIVKTRISDRGIHVSGHAHRDEQRRMLELVRPRSFMPVHGTLHHLLRHAALARAMGVTDVVTAENGHLVQLGPSGIAKIGGVHHGRVHTWAGREVPLDVIRQRRIMAESGAIALVVPLEAGVARADRIRVAFFGVAEDARTDSLTREIREHVAEAIAENLRLGPPLSDPGMLAEAGRQAARRVCFRHFGFKPVTKLEVLS